MTQYLVFDTETSGLFDFRKSADAPGQPRLASFCSLEVDENFEITDTFNTLVQPSGWEITPEAAAINGLTKERCEAEGVDIRDVLQYYQMQIEAGRVLLAYNAQFDTKVMRREFRLLELPDLFETTPNICVMRACHTIGIPKLGEKKGGFPKLSDSYAHLLGKPMGKMHEAFADALACYKIAAELQKRGALPSAEIHYAKNRPEAAAPSTPVAETDLPF